MDDRRVNARKLARDRLTWEHIAFAFALSGPYGAIVGDRVSLLSEQSVLSILRSLLTIRTASVDPDDIGNFEAQIQACYETLLQILGEDTVANLDRSKLDSQETRFATQHVAVTATTSIRKATTLYFGVGDTLAMLLASRTPFNIELGYSELYAKPAHANSRRLLLGHSKVADFDRWVEDGNDETRSISRFTDGIEFAVLRFLRNASKWSFWLDWYQGFLNGHPLDWELQRRVALIEDTIWDAGPEAVAAEIEKIREEYQRTVTPLPQRFPELEPTSTKRLISNAATISPALSGLSFQIESAQAQFHQFGYNQIPDTFLPLVELPALLNNISSKLDAPAPNSDIEDALRAEVGRLNAKVIALEAALDEALRNQATSFKGILKEHCAKSLGDWKLYAAIVSGLFLLSGDDLTLKERGETLMKKCEQLFGDVDPSPAAQSLIAKVQHTKGSNKNLP